MMTSGLNPPQSTDGGLRLALWLDERTFLTEFTFLRQLCVALRAERHHVVIVAPESVALQPLAGLVAEQFVVKPASLPSALFSRDRRTHAKLANQLRSQALDAVILFGFNPTQSPVLAELVTTVLLRWHFDLNETQDVGLDVHRIFATAELQAAYASVSPARGTVIPPGVFTHADLPVRPKQDGMFSIACLDMIQNPAEIEGFLRAFSQIPPPAATMALFLDTGPAVDAVWRMARDMKLSARVSFIPAIAAASCVISSVDALINIEPQTRFWHAGLEAMAAMCPTACRGRSVGSLFCAQTSRIVSRQADWGSCLTSLESDHATSRLLATTAANRVREQYAMSTTASQLSHLLKVLKRGSLALELPPKH